MKGSYSSILFEQVLWEVDFHYLCTFTHSLEIFIALTMHLAPRMHRWSHDSSYLLELTVINIIEYVEFGTL